MYGGALLARTYSLIEIVGTGKRSVAVQDPILQFAHRSPRQLTAINSWRMSFNMMPAFICELQIYAPIGLPSCLNN